MSPTHGPLPVPRDQPGGGVLAGSHRGRRPACVRALGRGLWLHPLSALTTHSQGSGPGLCEAGYRSPARPPRPLWPPQHRAAARRRPVVGAPGRGPGLSALQPPSSTGPGAPPRRPASRLAPRPLPRVPALPLGLRRRCSAYSSIRTPGAAVHLGRRRLPEGAFALAGHPQVFAAVRGFLCGAEDEGGR